jgi:hypothetical protein
VSVERRGAVVGLDLAGELDMATAPRVGEAMAWLRASTAPGTTIVIDTTRIDFVAAAGYRAVRAALVGPDGLWDARVTLVVGPALARLEAAISAASRPRDRGGERIGPGPTGREPGVTARRSRPEPRGGTTARPDRGPSSPGCPSGWP